MREPTLTFYLFLIFIMHIHTICVLVLCTTHARSITVLIPQSLLGLLTYTWHKEAQTIFPPSFSLLFFLLLLLLLSRFSHVRLCDPIDGSRPGSPVPGILQARTLQWVAISFSNAWKWKVKVKSLSRVQLFATPWTAAYQAPPSMGFSRQEFWSVVPLPSPNRT